MTEAAALHPHVNWSPDPNLNESHPNSPLMKKTVLQTTLPPRSPPPQNSFLPTCFASDDSYYGTLKDQIQPGDGFLVQSMDNSRNPSIAQNATVMSLPPLLSRSNGCDRDSLWRPETAQQATSNSHPKPKESLPNPSSLEHLAANALQHVVAAEPPIKLESHLTQEISASTYQLSIQDRPSDRANPVIVNDLSKFRKEHARAGNLSPPPVLTSDSAGLPPISPRGSEYDGQPLPSIRSTFAGIDLSPKDQSSVAQGGPGSGPGLSPALNLHQLPPLTGSHGTAPISPPDSYQASPQALPVTNSFLPHTQGRQQTKITEHEPNGETKAREKSATISIPVPSTSVSHRGSTSESSNTQIATYVCNYAGCKAPPFQTQYLLNSHTNVHSSDRPHFCPVKGCPRSDGGKGFKRKNEMLRHGLVHDSPGYVCPFCPDRDHRYPRPDNLQRHVRVHHSDKNRDDPQLRNVLAQRADGPSRGRRRRGIS